MLSEQRDNAPVRTRAGVNHPLAEVDVHPASDRLNLKRPAQPCALDHLTDRSVRLDDARSGGSAEAAAPGARGGGGAGCVTGDEQYYRTMFGGRVSSWNLRDRHMFQTLEALDGHLSRYGRQAKIVAWEQNSHLGDARATEMRTRGEMNVGQLIRERFGRDAVLVGFTTYAGTVTAANDWDAPADRKQVRPALPGSYEALFHEAWVAQFLLPCATARRHQTI